MMFERSAALALTVMIFAVSALAMPYQGAAPHWWPRQHVRIVYACPQGYVCFQAKDESRHVNPGLLPSRLVQTTAYQRPADIPPAVQAQDNRKKKPGRR